MTCHISNQIAEHCNQPEEIFCPECDGKMTHDKDGDLQCDDVECGHVIILNSDDFDF
jgi:hypothetical protein